MRQHRVAILLGAVALLGAGAFGMACSSSTSGHGFAEDDAGGNDATTQETGGNETGVPDRASDVPPPPDAGGPEVKGACDPVSDAGSCDIVLQNCAAGKQCVQVSATQTGCVTPGSAQHLPKGHACCPNRAKSPEQCAPGLECLGLPDDPCAADAGLTGRCSPACCDDDICGKSDPEGFTGRCDLNIVDSQGTRLYSVCDYDPPCKPFHVKSCPQGFTCLITDQLGTSSCVPIFATLDGGGATSAGYPEGHTCESANSCADGLLCLGPPDGGATCTWLCLTPASNPPFDAGALRDASAGYGGCPSNERCIGSITGPIPVWVSFCAP